MALVNLKSSSYKIDTDAASSNINSVVTINKTFIDKSFNDSDLSTGQLNEYTTSLNRTVDLNTSYTLPKGKYNSDITLTIPSIYSYTNANINSNSNSIFNGYTAYINGILVTGTGKTMSHNAASNSGVSTSAITISWGYSSGWISGVAVCCKTGGYNTTDPGAYRVYLGSGTSCTITGLAHSTTYYITIFPYCMVNNTYLWYAPNGTIVSAQSLAIGTACSYCNQCVAKCSCNGYCSCNDSCGCNNNCNQSDWSSWC